MQFYKICKYSSKLLPSIYFLFRKFFTPEFKEQSIMVKLIQQKNGVGTIFKSYRAQTSKD